MTDPIAEAFRRLEEWRSQRHDREWVISSPCKDALDTLFMVSLHPTKPPICKFDDTFPAAVDAALAQWERDNG